MEERRLDTRLVDMLLLTTIFVGLFVEPLLIVISFGTSLMRSGTRPGRFMGHQPPKEP